MDATWKNEFMPWILARGQQYYEDGRVTRIYQQGNTIRATVIGTEDYNTEVDLPGGTPKFMLCTCPYAVQSNCKHMAALLFAVEESDYTFTEEIPERNSFHVIERVNIKESWLDAINNLPEAVIRAELMKLAERNEDLRQKLTIKHLGGLPDGQINNWKADLQEIAFSYMNHRGYIDQCDVYEFLWEAQNILENAIPSLMKVNAIMDAFKLTWMVYETVAEVPMDDSDHDIDLLISDCEDYWREQFKMSIDTHKEEMHSWYWNHRTSIQPEIRQELDRFFLLLPWSEALYQKNIELYHQHIDTFSSEKDNAK